VQAYSGDAASWRRLTGAVDLQGLVGAEDRKRGGHDRLIASHAISLRLPPVTNNVRDFGDMPGLWLENRAAE
jgi:predicted nucleic acid-binding protein